MDINLIYFSLIMKDNITKSNCTSFHPFFFNQPGEIRILVAGLQISCPDFNQYPPLWILIESICE